MVDRPGGVWLTPRKVEKSVEKQGRTCGKPGAGPAPLVALTLTETVSLSFSLSLAVKVLRIFRILKIFPLCWPVSCNTAPFSATGGEVRETAAEKKSFLLYFDMGPSIRCLPPEQRGYLLTALYDFAEAAARGEASTEAVLQVWPQMRPETQMAFRFMAEAVRRDTEKWRKRRENCRAAALERVRQASDARAAGGGGIDPVFPPLGDNGMRR